MAVRGFLATSVGLREALLLLSPDGLIVDANAAAWAILQPAGKGVLFTGLMEEGAAAWPAYIRRCSGSAQPLPGVVVLRGEAGPQSYRCEGSRYQPDPAHPPMILLALRPRARASDAFQVLTRQVEALNAEIAARQRAMEALAQAVEARDGLLRELQHRVRNTIQLFIALLQNGQTADGMTAAQAARLSQQFQAVGFVQQQMTTAHDLREVALRPLVDNLAGMMAPEPPQAGFRVTGEAAVDLPVARATPLAILLAHCLAGTGAALTGSRTIGWTLAEGTLTIRIDQPGPREACEALLAEDLAVMLAEQLDATLGCERLEALWQAVITLPPI